MKIRIGFVSNSSSSSFVVRLADGYAELLCDNKDDKKKNILTDKQEDLVRSYGFLPSPFSYPSQVEAVQGKQLGGSDSDNLFYYVECNQADVIEWLVSKRIPFKGAIHYGQETVLYDGESSYVTIIPNLGILAEMYGEKHIQEMEITEKCIRSERKEI